MPTSSTLAVFIASSFVLLMIPGPSVLFVVARTLEHGRTAGLVSMLGVETGALLHVAAAAVGLSALVATCPPALVGIKIAGALYLLAMGVATLRRAGQPPERALPQAPGASRARLFRQGVLVDLLNPKTAMFFLAFLPQFVEPQAGAVALQTAVLGLCFVALATLSDGAYALAAGALAGRLGRSASAHRRLQRVSAATYVGLGALTGAAPA